MERGIPINYDLWRHVSERWPLVRQKYLQDNDPLQLLFPSGEVNRQALTNYLLKNEDPQGYLWVNTP
jgi:hypothetical protein